MTGARGEPCAARPGHAGHVSGGGGLRQRRAAGGTAVGVPQGARVGSTSPTAQAGPASCSRVPLAPTPRAAWPGSAAAPAPWTRRKRGFPSAKRKEDTRNPFPPVHFHRLALPPRVREAVHRPFPPRPSPSQHTGTRDHPSEGRLAEDSPRTVKASVPDGSRSFRSSRLTLESSCPGMQFLQGVHFPCSSRYSLSWQCIGAGEGPGAWGGEEQKAERSQPAPTLPRRAACPSLGRRFCSGRDDSRVSWASRTSPRRGAAGSHRTAGCSGSSGTASQRGWGYEPRGSAAPSQPS